MDKISIIVPIYNGEKFLLECIESILNQTYKNIEVILIDDGSSDNTKKICVYLKNKDSRVKYFFQNNYGVSAARNYGLKKSSGNYIGFVDADDFIDKEMYNILIKKIVESNTDLIMCNYFRYINSKNYEIQTEPFNYGYCDKNSIVENLIALMIGSNNEDIKCPPIMGSNCRCLYKKSIIDKFNLRFKDIKIAEDMLFHLEYLCHINNAYVINKPLYYYRLNPNSATHKYISNFYDTLLKQRNYMIKILKDNDLYTNTIEQNINNSWLYNMTWCIVNEINNSAISKKELISRIKKIRNNIVYNQMLKHKFIKKIYWKERIIFYLIEYRLFRISIWWGGKN